MILITGGAGFIGTRLAERLLEQGETVKIFDDLSSGSATNVSKLTMTGGAEFVKGDVRDATSIAAASDGCDLIYHQPVIKPALVGLAGPWISGGIEFNWPQHHRPATFLPVDFPR